MDAEAGTDLITSLLSRVAYVLNIDIDIRVWSRLLGLVLLGSIILANLRNVLASVSRVSSREFRKGQTQHKPDGTPPLRSFAPLHQASASRSCSCSWHNSWSVISHQSRLGV